LHGFADAKMEKGQDEWRLMVQIECRCPLDKQDALLELVRGFGAREVPAELSGASSSRRRQNAEEAVAAAVRARARARCDQLLVT
jgi:hypothetical protein